MEAIITVKFTLPDSSLQDTIDDLGDENEYTLESLFWEHVKDWLEPNPYMHKDTKLERLVDSPPPKKRPKRVTEIGEPFRVDMREKFPSLSFEDLEHEIELAMAHQASTKYHDKQRYVINWLKKAVEYREAHAPPAPRSREQRQEEERAKYTADYRRRRAEDDYAIT